MGERTNYAPGTFSWADVTTTDQPAAKDFYGGLFGWEAEDMPVGEGVYYSMMRLNGKDVAAISPQPRPQRYLVVKNGDRANGGIRELGDQPAPPHWLVYFGIDEIDAGLAKVEELGGSKMAGPIDIGIAKIGIVQDPQGAAFAIYDGQFEA